MPEFETREIAPERVAFGRLRCREICDEDRASVAALLARGFGCAPAFWQTALARLASHEPPKGLPRYGYLLESAGVPVGALLLIFSTVEENGRPALRCNVSSWYVEPGFRAFAPLLVARALRHRDATYINLTPAPQTVPILRAQGYREFCRGRFFAFPVFGRSILHARVETNASFEAAGTLSNFDRQVLDQHSSYGCLSLVCIGGGETFPFVLAVRRRAGVPVAALLVYCRSLETFRLCAGALGRHLARRGIFCIMVHANAALADVPGFFRHTKPIYYVGDVQPRPGNLAWSECAMFGVRP